MKVKVKDLQPNPFRDIDNYPIDSERVESLAKSINQTGFWDNILARKRDGRIEIAYGHHRLVVLKRDFELDHVINIPVKDLDDETMFRIMANENMQEWDTSVAIIHETVRSAYEFLKDRACLHKSYSKEHGGIEFYAFEKLPKPKKHQRGIEGDDGWKISVVAKQISNWLGGNWLEEKVWYSLNRLKLIEKDILDKEAVESMPTEQAARDFTAAVKEVKPSKETQRVVAKKIVVSRTKKHTEEGSIIGKYRIEAEMHEEEHGDEEKAREERREVEEKARRRQFENYLTQVKDKADSLRRSLTVLMEYKDILLSEHYQKSKEGQEFVYAMAELFNTFRILMIKKGKEVNLVESFKLLVESKKEAKK